MQEKGEDDQKQELEDGINAPLSLLRHYEPVVVAKLKSFPFDCESDSRVGCHMIILHHSCMHCGM